MKKILIVDDEKHIVEFLDINLKRQGYLTITLLDSENVLETAIKEKPDCILLDIMMPKINGYEVCRRLKEDVRTSSIPVIMLTAKSDEADSILGLGIGADDYIVKPFSIKVLFARIEALLRRYNFGTIAGDITIANVKYKKHNSNLIVNEKVHHLTPNENLLIELLLKNANNLVTREEMIETIYPDNLENDTRAVDVHISSIRKKLENSDLQITAIRGKGYILNV